MTVIPIEMLREHRYRDDSHRLGDIHVLPRKWSGDLDEESAVIAISTGAARARVPLTKDQALAVELLKAARANDYDRIEQLRREHPDLLPAAPASESTELPPTTTKTGTVSTDTASASTSKRKPR